jgi:hypothetical protein
MSYFNSIDEYTRINIQKRLEHRDIIILNNILPSNKMYILQIEQIRLNAFEEILEYSFSKKMSSYLDYMKDLITFYDRLILYIKILNCLNTFCGYYMMKKNKRFCKAVLDNIEKNKFIFEEKVKKQENISPKILSEYITLIDLINSRFIQK